LSIFGSEKVIKQRISESNWSTYLVGFDINDTGTREYRWGNLIQLLIKVIPEFAFGFHDGTQTDNTELISKVSDAARSIYKIDEFQKVKDIYLSGDYIKDDDLAKAYLKRGEFGELILHLILRDYYSTIPLLSKIFFKDSYGHTVHGFDAVHIEPKSRTLWLGESKLYIDGKQGVKALIEDIKQHILRDYLHDEFTLVSKKVKLFENIPEKEYWLNLIDSSTTLSEQLNSITIPLLCTYSSENFSKYDNEAIKEFIDEYEKEVRSLKDYFDTNNNHPLKTDINTVLLLFPVKCKVELVKKLHHKLSLLQQVGE
jgi:hypothetical protein